MEMLNRAIEDAADFQEFARKLQERRPGIVSDPIMEKQPGESRQQYRERVRREAKAAKRARA